MPLRLWKIWALTFMMRLDTATAELEQIAGALTAEAKPAWLAHRDKLAISIASRRDDIVSVTTLATAWLDRWRSLDPFHAAAVCVLQALAHFHLFEEPAQRRDLCTARQCAHEAASAYAEAWIGITEALIEFQCGRAGVALDHIETALQRGRASDALSVSMLATLSLVAARLHAEAGNIVEARRHFSAGQASWGCTGLSEVEIAASEVAVILAERSAGPDTALSDIAQTPIRGRRLELASKLLAIELRMRARRPIDAAQTFDAAFTRHGTGFRCTASGDLLGPEYMPDLRHMEAWLALATGDAPRALACATALLGHAEAHGRGRRRVTLLLLAASASADHSDARRFLIRALRLAAEGGLFQTVVDHAWALGPAIAIQIDPAELGKSGFALLLQLRERFGVSAADDDDDDVLESLTPREREVLRLLDSGLTTQLLADRLDLSLSTAKWHTRNIYNKLDVRNRSGALAKARRLALL